MTNNYRPPTRRTAGRHLSDLDEEERYRSFDDRQLAMPAVWESMQRGFADESVVVVPSISIERTTRLGVAPSCRRWRNAHCSCCCCSASRSCA